MKDVNILVTGANGLIGHHLCKRLLREGFNVWALTRSEAPALLAAILDHPRLNLLRGDIHNREFLSDLFQRQPFQVVFHLAVERYFPGKNQEEKAPFFQETSAYRTNYEGTLNLLQAATRHQSPIWIQSSAMMIFDISQPSAVPIGEQQPPAPVEVNGMSVLLAEQACHYIGRTCGLQYLILRYPGVYGSGKDGGAIAKFARLCLSDAAETITAPSDRKSDFLYVQDTVNANMLAMAKMLNGDGNKLSGKTYHIGSEKATSVAEMANIIRQLSGAKNVKIVDTPSGHPRQFFFDITAASRDLDYHPKSTQENLAAYLKELQQAYSRAERIEI